MTAHAIVTISVTNPDSLNAYREKAGAALAKYQAQPVAISAAPEVLEGDGTKPDVSVVLSFPDRDHALNWINDPELAEVHALRRGAGQSNIILL